MFLSEGDLKQLTGKQQRSAQVRALRSMGITHKIRPDGFPLVAQTHLLMSLDGLPKESTNKEVKPNWDAINA